MTACTVDGLRRAAYICAIIFKTIFMKKTLLLCAVVALSFAANAQSSKLQASIGPRIGVVVGDYDDFFGLVVGGELQGEYKFNPQVSATVMGGYTYFSGKNNVDGSGIIPIMAGLRYYPSSQFFLGGRLGVGVGTEDDSESSFGFEPQIGYNGRRVQLALGYQSYPNQAETIVGDFSLSHVGLSLLLKL